MSSTALTLSTAQAITGAVVDEARSQGLSVAVVVGSVNGTVIALASMDGASPLAAEIAREKLYTVLRTGGRPTAALEAVVANDPIIDRVLRVDPRLMPVGGGEPIRVDGELLGAVAVSGAPTSAGDAELARQGIRVP